MSRLSRLHSLSYAFVAQAFCYPFQYVTTTDY